MIDISALDPVAFSIGPLAIRWYALAYMAGILLGWRYMLWMASRQGGALRPNRDDVDDFVSWAVAGVILGGRAGYVLFYNFSYYVDHPLEILKIWHGGMAFHGGIIGVFVAMLFYARVHKISFLRLADMTAAAAPIGLFFGRLANFINGELFGRPTDLPWGVVFPRGGDVPRHPSQLYEAGLEGVVLFVVLWLCVRSRLRACPGVCGGVFLAGYGLFRALVECVRAPDAQIGLLPFGVTMGQILSLPMIIVGVSVVVWALRRKEQGGAL